MPSFSIGSRKVGLQYPPLVIAEIGINHNGDFEKAEKMVYDAHGAGCECIKFQCHIIEDEMIYTDVVPGNAKESIWDIMKRAVLTEKEELDLKRLTESLGMIYLSTPFSRAAADRLCEMNIPAYKIGSGECNNYPLIRHIASFGKPIILSTGMNDIASIQPAVDILRKANIPFALMHCTSMYPTPYDKVRLGCLAELQQAFPDAVLGLSDHSMGNWTCYAAVALGASIVEKHFTSSLDWAGPDIPISITPLELSDLITGCNAIYIARGGNKIILDEEQVTINFAYASVVSIQDIKKGDPFTMENIWVKRPGTGELHAKHFDSIIGKQAAKDIKKDTQLKETDVNLEVLPQKLHKV